LGGIAVFASICETAKTSKLFALSPGAIIFPSSPPLSAASKLSSRRLALGRCSPWQRKHDAWKIGLMSFS
jgi:hypothetical protein